MAATSPARPVRYDLIARTGDPALGTQAGVGSGVLSAVQVFSDSGDFGLGRQLRESGFVSGVNFVWAGTHGSPPTRRS
jgi:hypothetical protein